MWKLLGSFPNLKVLSRWSYNDLCVTFEWPFHLTIIFDVTDLLIVGNPYPRGGPYSASSLTKKPEEKDPPRSTWYKFFEGGPLDLGSWLGKLPNRRPPQGGGFPAMNIYIYIYNATYRNESRHMTLFKWPLYLGIICDWCYTLYYVCIHICTCCTYIYHDIYRNESRHMTVFQLTVLSSDHVWLMLYMYIMYVYIHVHIMYIYITTHTGMSHVTWQFFQNDRSTLRLYVPDIIRIYHVCIYICTYYK